MASIPWLVEAKDARPADRTAALQARSLLCAALLALTLVLGGGGSPAPRAELALELAALAAIPAWLVLPARCAAPVDRTLLVAAVLAVALPLVQLLPLPPQLWQALPGREAEHAALHLAGAAGGWMPLSLTPARTLASALSLIPPLVVLGFAAQLPVRDRTVLIAVVLAAAVVSAALGVAQLASGSAGGFRFYGSAGLSYASGLFANRNADADLLLAGLIALPALAAAYPRLVEPATARLAWAALAVFLLLALVLTRSRAGMVLSGVPLVLAPLLLRPWLHPHRRQPAQVAGAILVALAAGFLALHDQPALRQSWSRFGLAADNRADLRADTRYAIQASWPAGTGLGSFEPVFVAAERLETVDRTWPNRAHNDYLEFTLEAGVFAPLLLLAAAAAIAARAIRLLRAQKTRERRAQVLFALATLAVFALHALVDYPMRAMALACLAALTVAMLAHAPQAEARA